MVNQVFCFVEHTLSVIGGKWKAVILWHLCQENKGYRYGEIKQLLPKINHKILSQQLKELHSDELITRVQFNSMPPKVEYKISKKGETLLPILELMHYWGNLDLQEKPSTSSQKIKEKIVINNNKS
ncbi:helix-turn-helix transcriptional regulator [Candidatus Hepatincola sp. Av]